MSRARRRAAAAGLVLVGALAVYLLEGRPEDASPVPESAVSGGSPGRARTVDLVSSTWRKVQEGLDVVTAELRAGDAERGRLVALYADLAHFRPRLLLNPELRPLSELVEGRVAASNAGYFTSERRPTGLLASGGEVLHPFVAKAGSAGSGIFVVDDGAARLLERDAVGDRDFDDVELAIQAGPRVIEPDGSLGIHGDDGMRANRTVIGIDGRGRLALVVVYAGETGLRRGLTLFELQHALGPSGLGRVDPALALRAALNLDGGPSTGLHARAPAPRLELEATSRVVSVLTLEKR